MGCKQVKVNPSEPTNENELKTTQVTVRNISTQSEGQLPVLNTNPLSVLALAPATLANINELELATKPLESVAATNLNPNDVGNAIMGETSNKSGGVSPTSDDRNETVVYRQNILRRPASYADMSNFPEDSSVTIKSNDSQEPYSLRRSLSSSLENSEMRAHGQYAIQRFISARADRPANQGSTHHGNWSEQDDSYSLRDSLASTASADSEASVAQLPRGAKARHVHPKNLNLKRKVLDHETSDDSDGSELQHVTDTYSMTIDVQGMTERLVSNLRSVSPKLSNLGYQPKGPISETSSESDEK